MPDLLTEAFVRIKERLMGRADKVLRNGTEAEDILQEAFLRLWGRYSPGSAKEAEALLSKVVKNVSLNARRRKRSVPIHGDLQEDGPGNAAERESRFLWLENAIDSELNETQKYIIRRHEYESAPLNEIAEELKMQPPAVRMQLSRARKLLREKYHEQD
ncbi:MAG: sigma-70 family RNA polymerase sigma factor [Bacteroidales bacterium]|nr:sigma-70 family RNA polymerase sigma factor [Bacteroidales bacterium]